MFNLQGSEIIFILLLALVILGPEKLPGAIRRFTRTYAELRKMGTGFQQELKSALDEPMREMRETADKIKDSADPSNLVDDEPSGRREEKPAHPGGAADEAFDEAPGGDPAADAPPANDPFGRPGVATTAVSPNGSGTDSSPDDDPFADPTDEEADEEAAT